MKTERIKLWDLPTRVFHWLLMFLIVAAIVKDIVTGIRAWYPDALARSE